MTRYEMILNYLKTLRETYETDTLVSIHNEYCDSNNCMDDYIYSMNDFDEIFSGSDPWEVARTCFYGDFRPTDDYFYFNGYGNCCSFDVISNQENFTNSPVYLEDIASYMDDNDDDLGCSEIREIIENYEELEAEEV